MYHLHEQRKVFDPKGAAEAEGATEQMKQAYQQLEQEVKHGELAERIRAFEEKRRRKPVPKGIAKISTKVRSRSSEGNRSSQPRIALGRLKGTPRV